MRKIGIAMLSALMLCGCTSAAKSDSSHVSSSNATKYGCEISEASCTDTVKESEDPSIGQKSDMSGYESYDVDTDYVFVNSDVQHLLSRMSKGDTFVTFFGFSSCPWCRDAMPILNQAASEYGFPVDYINTRSDPSWQSNLDLKDYDKLLDVMGDLFPTDENGKQHMDVPFVVFFKDGKIVKSVGHPDYDAHKRKISDGEAKQEKNDYVEGFQMLQS